MRLDSGKGWCSLNNESQPQLIIDFNNIVTISKIGTQGISSNGTSIFASKYRVQFGYNGNDWYDYKAKDGKVVRPFLEDHHFLKIVPHKSEPFVPLVHCQK